MESIAWKSIFDFSHEKPWFFTEFTFLAVFGVFLIIYSFLKDGSKARSWYLILFSLFFYYKSSGPFLVLFLFMIISDYWFARAIQKLKGTAKKLILMLSVAISLSFLLYFKYIDFFVFNINSLFGTKFDSYNLFLPIGISFYTFQSISYLVDVYREELKATENFRDYAFYMTFFPHLVAGPIVRAKDFLPQIYNPVVLHSRFFGEAMFKITVGLLKKLLIADYLGKYVDIVHADPRGFSGVEHLVSMYAYTFQIYFDFSGYSDIAIGLALLMGYRLKENFDLPYLATNITEFWRKWHISLSHWLRDYIYIPLGGSRNGPVRTYIFLMTTMLIGGFWHGADWRFVFWGFAHGFALAVHKLWLRYFKGFSKNLVGNFFGLFLTFQFVSLCWIFFRANSFDSAFHGIIKILLSTQWDGFYAFACARPEFSFVFLIAAILVFMPNHYRFRVYSIIVGFPIWSWLILLLGVLQVIVQFKDDVVPPFIYFQF
jgi:D-alanyl-lipoteichoic acid acyltransferase DltB (MBOAT superfamily)